MRGQIRHTTNGIALYLNVGAEHLPNERLKTTKFDDEQLVVSCRATSAPKSAQAGNVRTIYSQVSQGRACSPLHFGIVTTKEEEDGVERVPADRANFFLGDFGKRKCGAALEVDIIGE